MQRIIAIAILILSWNVYSQDLNGVVQADSSKLPLHGAHVRNLSKKLLVTTAADGAFEIPASIGDTLLITFVGYQDYFMRIDGEHVQKRLAIYLKEKEVTLDEVVVTPYSEYPEKPVIELDSLIAIPMGLPEVTPDYNYDPREEPIPDKLAPTFTVGFRFDLEKFTKRRKEKTHYLESLDQTEKWKIAEAKFNREWLTEITKLEGDALTYFIAYCNFSVDYLVQASIMDIQDHVLAKLEKYQQGVDPR